MANSVPQDNVSQRFIWIDNNDNGDGVRYFVINKTILPLTKLPLYMLIVTVRAAFDETKTSRSPIGYIAGVGNPILMEL